MGSGRFLILSGCSRLKSSAGVLLALMLNNAPAVIEHVNHVERVKNHEFARRCSACFGEKCQVV